jgi:hypothetical protein
MGGLTLFGLPAVTAMLIFYALEDRNPGFIIAFAGACALASIYGFLQGAWPLGVIEAIWVWRWRNVQTDPRPSSWPACAAKSSPPMPMRTKPGYGRRTPARATGVIDWLSEVTEIA